MTERKVTINEHCPAFSAMAEVYDPRIIPWEEIASDILTITSAAFHDYKRPPKEIDLKEAFQDQRNTIVLLRPEERIVGYTVAKPRIYSLGRGTAYITVTAIHPDFQRKGLLPSLLGVLDETLKEKGFKYIQRDARIRHGYADVLTKVYAGKIESQYDWYNLASDEYQRYLLIKL